MPQWRTPGRSPTTATVSVRTMLADVHRLTPREATARAQRRDQLAGRRSLTGEAP